MSTRISYKALSEQLRTSLEAREADLDALRTSYAKLEQQTQRQVDKTVAADAALKAAQDVMRQLNGRIENQAGTIRTLEEELTEQQSAARATTTTSGSHWEESDPWWGDRRKSWFTTKRLVGANGDVLRSKHERCTQQPEPPAPATARPNVDFAKAKAWAHTEAQRTGKSVNLADFPG